MATQQDRPGDVMPSDDADLEPLEPEGGDGRPRSHTQFPCKQCGAVLQYRPGTTVLKCQYCGHENPIAASTDAIEELDYHQALAAAAGDQVEQVTRTVKCDSCAAQTTLPPAATAGQCAFCGSDIVAAPCETRSIRPRALLPFAIHRDQSLTLFRQWLHSLWFAPGSLKKMAQADRRITGMYVPYWTYDADTTTHYTGQRGDDYWVTVGSGKNRRTERRTRWRSVSGRVRNSFDDILVMASHSLPRKQADRLEPWDLGNLVPYAEQYLAGFQAESYQVTLDQGFAIAYTTMEQKIRSTIRSDIGGDHQRIHSVKTQFHKVTYKHILLPVWISAYRYHDRAYRFLVNGRTGEVQGERPWSVWKIALAVGAGLIAVGGLAMLVLGQG